MPSDEDRAWTTDGISEDAHAALANGLPASRVWSLLMAVLARRAAERDPARLVRQWENDGFTRPGPIDQRTLAELDLRLLAAAGAFEAVELSPLAPLGACSVVGLASQNKVVSALRGTEVVADPTTALALECAVRLRKDEAQVVRLAASHRCVRAQELPKGRGFAPHFRMFCLATAGRERKEHGLLVEALAEQIATHLSALDRLETHGYCFPGRTVVILATPERAPLGDRVAAAIPGPVVRERLDHPYYDGLRFMIRVGSDQAGPIPLVDGGAFDWLARLTSNRRLVFVASGMGSQLAATLYRGGSGQAPP
jgi:hypothetical protein